MELEIPVTADGKSVEELQGAVAQATVLPKELEQTFGAYTHEGQLINCTGTVDGGMEYAGAATTSLTALGHENAHLWFSRG